MASGLVEETPITLTARLFKVETMGEEYYFTSILGIAAGSGPTPEAAYRSLAHCLAVGDMDVDSRKRIEPWRGIIQRAVVEAHAQRTTKLPSSGDAEGQGIWAAS